MSVLDSTVQGLFESVSGNVNDVRSAARGENVSSWKTAQLAKATTIGAGAAAIPVAGYLTLPADLLALMRIMHRSAIGISEIKTGYADDETFANILGVWGGSVSLDNSLRDQIKAAALAHSAVKVGGKVGIKMAIKGFTICSSAIMAKKLGPKVAAKVAAKMSAKLAAKATTRWIPVISAVVGGGANWWIIDSVNTASEEYCDFILKVSNESVPHQIEHH